jgi:pheromone shutdown protein TraB
MYKNMSKDIIGNENGSGGEFLVAIRAAKACPSCHTLVLGDRSSLTTIRRAALLAMKSGDPLGVLNRLQQSNAEEMEQLETRVRNDLMMAKANNKSEVDQSEVQLAMMETLKVDTQFRNRLFLKLEQQVPEFTQAFLKERDHSMSESIRRELDLLSSSSTSTSTTISSSSNSKTVQHVVGVVGLAHVPGMEAGHLAGHVFRTSHAVAGGRQRIEFFSDGIERDIK